MWYFGCQAVPDSKPTINTWYGSGHISGVECLDADCGTGVDDFGLLLYVEFVVVEPVAYLAGLPGDPTYQLHFISVWDSIINYERAIFI